MPSEWPLVRLEDVTTILGDGLHGTPSYDDSGDYYFINGNNLSDGRIVFNENTRRVTESESLKHRKNLNDRTVLVSINGTLGNVALYRGEKVVLGKSACYFNVRHDVDRQFVRYVITSAPFQSYIHTLATGSTIKNVSLRLMRDFSFHLPPLKLQKEISAIFVVLDDRINLLHETNTTLEAIPQALFKSWFVDFDPVRAKVEGRAPEGVPPEIAALFPSEFEKSALGEIPKGWTFMRLDEACDINPTRRLSKGAMAPYLEMASVPTQGHRTETPAVRAFTSGTRFVNGDTLLARITPCLENGKTAFVDFLSEDETGWGSTEYIVLRPRQPLPPYWAYLLCRHSTFRQYAIQAMVGTSGRQRVEVSRLAQYRVSVPDERVTSAFGAMVEPLHSGIAFNDEAAKTLAALRDNLLPRLMSGKLRIPEMQKAIEEASA